MMNTDLCHHTKGFHLCNENDDKYIEELAIDFSSDVCNRITDDRGIDQTPIDLCNKANEDTHTDESVNFSSKSSIDFSPVVSDDFSADSLIDLPAVFCHENEDDKRVIPSCFDKHVWMVSNVSRLKDWLLLSLLHGLQQL